MKIIDNVENPYDISLAGRESIENILSLPNSAHSIWNDGNFALKPNPRSEDDTSIRLHILLAKRAAEIRWKNLYHQ